MALFSSLLRSDSVPSGFITFSPSAQAIGNQVKTSQPPQSPPKNVPWTSPPSFWTARASAANSASVAGGLLGSRPATLKSFLLYIQTGRTTTKGRPTLLFFHVDAPIGARGKVGRKGKR